jgi:threonine dehydrogenase-like Zn-dependent dehydrogenase
VGGGWSEEMLLHEQQLFRVPTDMLDTQAVLLEPSAVALHAVLRHVPQPGDRVLIIGAGTIGLLTLQAVRALAPQAEISVQARYPFQVEKATRMGAAHIIYPQDSYAGVQQATQAQLYTGILGNQMLLGGYDVIYDTIGTQKTIHNALRWARAKATVVLIGLSLHMMHIDLTPVWYQEINLIGTLGQGMETWPPASDTQRSTFSIATDMIMHNVLQPEQLITHHFALNNYRQALLTAINKRDQRTIKVVFDYSLLPASVVPNVRASARQRRQATVDIRMTSPLATKDLTQKELPAPLPLSEHPVTPMPLSTPILTPELPPRIVPVPVETNSSHPLPLPTLDDEEQPVGTNISHPLPDERIIETEQPIGTDVSHPLPNDEQPVGTDSSRPLDLQDISDDDEQPIGTDVSRPLPDDDEPLNELEWLDVIHAEQTMPEVQYVPDVADAPPLSEEAWLEEEPVLYNDEAPHEKDFTQEVDRADEPRVDEETATNASIETLLTTKTTKAINPGRQRSKNRHKGKNTTGSFRS